MDDYVYIIKINNSLVCSCQPDFMTLVTVLDDLSVDDTTDLKSPAPCAHIILAGRFNITLDLGLSI